MTKAEFKSELLDLLTKVYKDKYNIQDIIDVDHLTERV